ncbi:glycosyltransferase [Larkinella sp. VNQ87]|uniref:glycosyltransferase n=1 Tax=Larkinella sp. VNQ87 TaxID=3400921 RepID=UPI003C07356A
MHPMKLLINAFNLASAGGLNVALNFLSRVPQLKGEADIIHLVAPKNCGYEALESSQMTIHYLPPLLNHWSTRPLTDLFWYPSLLKEIKPDIIFSMGNFPLPADARQVVLLMLPHLAYPEDRVLWKILGYGNFCKSKLREWVFKNRFKYVDTLLVQTETMRMRLRQVFRQLPPVQLFPAAYTLLDSQAMYRLPVAKKPGRIYLLCLSRYYPHKNLEILVDVAQIIKNRQLPYRMLITIEANQHPRSARLLQQITGASLDDVLIPVGNVPITCVASLYEQVDGMIMPTLMESFSATYVDAMHFGVSIFTSQRDFAEEVCGECAFYFDPLSAQHIVDTIHAGFSDGVLRQRKIAAGRQRSTTSPTWAEASRNVWSLLKTLHERAETEIPSP